VRFVKLPADRFAGQASFDDSEVQAYFAEYGESFRLPERRSVDFLLVDRAQIQDTLTVGDDEIETYYNENAEEFTRQEEVQARHILLRTGEDRTAEAARDEIAAIRNRLDSGESFDAIAREVSDDTGSAAQGGDLGFFGRGQMVGPFEDAAFGAQPGDVVGPVETTFGLHLIEVLDRTEAGQQPLAEVAGAIRAQLLGERSTAAAQSKASELGERIRNEGIDTEEGLRALADAETGVTILSTEPFSQDDSVPGIGRMPAFTAAAFALEEGGVSEPVRVPQGWALLRLTGIEPSRLPELEEVSTDIVEALRGDREIELAIERLDAAREELAGGKSLDQLAADLDLEIEDAGPFGNDGTVGTLGVNPAISQAALELDQGEFGGPVAHERDAVLFEVTERTRFDPAIFEEEKARTRAELANERYIQTLTSLVNARREELDIRYHQSFIENFELGQGDVGS
jgi:peptidyl-prolyl cis-trans isomerase D